MLEGATGNSRAGTGDSPGASEDPAQRAKDICLRLLEFRPRTRAELQQALARKGIDTDTVEQVLSRLDAVGLIDDKSFAEMWVRSRHTYEGLGRQAIAAELRRKGVDDTVTADALTTVDYATEEERARQLVRKKLRTLTTADPPTKVRRLVGMLARKGYTAGMSYRIVREELHATGNDITLLDDTPPD
jgi:regulatory protein